MSKRAYLLREKLLELGLADIGEANNAGAL